ncbi:response regulator [Myxococcota bacterium]|nr:response regulator [Myxococcota bacterium]MBU1382591.1 response regulator [Myxococcota bacterium]MBU1495808.1 response regulator [Myxococcota bacterium]
MSEQGTTVLLIDDDPDISWMISRFLARSGFTVTLCANGNDAIEVLRNRDFNFVISDIQLPGINGIAVLEWIKANKPDIRVIIMTAYGAVTIKQISMGKGAILYLEKPIDPSLIIEVLKNEIKNGEEKLFKGTACDIELLEYIQFLLLTRKKVKLQLSSDGSDALIYFEYGKVVHAEYGNYKGIDAFYEIIKTFEHGSFITTPIHASPEVTIEKPGEFLLFEAARIKDEVTFGAGDENDEELEFDIFK